MKRWVELLVPAVLLVAALWLRWDDGPLVQRLRLLVFDTYQRLEPREYQPGQTADMPVTVPVRIVDIDEASLASVGQWPWPRVVLADLIAKLQAYGTATVGLDILLSEPDRTSPENMIALWRRFPEADAIMPQIRALPDPDLVLAETLAQGASVGAFSFASANAAADMPPSAGFVHAGDDPLLFVRHYPGLTPILPVLERAVAGRGFVDFDPELDGIVRRVPLLAAHDGRLFPSLAAEMLRVAQGARSYTIRASGASGEQRFGEATGIVEIRIGHAIVPTDRAGAVIFYDSGHRDDRFVSALEVLDGTADPNLLAGHLVLIGSTAAALYDIRATPLSPNMAGVEVQAQLLEQTIAGQFLHRPDWADGAELLYLALIGAVLIIAIRRTGALAGAATALGIVALSVALSWAAFHRLHWLVDPISPLIVALAVYLSGSLLGYLRTESERRQNRLVLGQYLPPRLVERYARDMGALRLGGETRELTILFTDIRGFTSIAERMAPEALTRLINEFLTPMTRIIQQETDGTIDKYIGDAIMAFWNAPEDDPAHVDHALGAALKMRAELARLNVRWVADATAKGETFVPLGIGIGINTGRCTVGNFGSDQRFDYSALGDSVNLASRLESLSRLYGVDIVVGEATARAAKGFPLMRIDRVRVKGRVAPEDVYTLLDAESSDGAAEATMRAFDEFFTLYCAGSMAKAAESLARLRDIAPSLASLCSLYEDRVRAYRANPPPADWDGVFVAGSKSG